jgi:hypothetical protein
MRELLMGKFSDVRKFTIRTPLTLLVDSLLYDTGRTCYGHSTESRVSTEYRARLHIYKICTKVGLRSD